MVPHIKVLTSFILLACSVLGLPQGSPATAAKVMEVMIMVTIMEMTMVTTTGMIMGMTMETNIVAMALWTKQVF